MAATREMTSEQIKDYLKTMYKADLGDLDPSTREVLENYSKIPAEEVMPHVYAIRDKAFAIYPYPCIGTGRFLQLALGRHGAYAEILTRMKTDKHHIYLDLGCAFAQDVRRLVADGVDSRQCYGSDLRLDFIDLGYELFRDRETLQSTFIAADIFAAESALAELYGRVDVINASSFFHLFSREAQLDVARQCVKLLKPQRDSLIVGRQRASVVAGDVQRMSGAPKRFLHNAESWREFWLEVGRETNVEFEVKVEMLAGQFGQLNVPTDDEAQRVSMSFSVRRLQKGVLGQEKQ